MQTNLLTISALCALQLRQADTITNMARGVVIVGPPAGPSLCYCSRMTPSRYALWSTSFRSLGRALRGDLLSSHTK